MIAGTLFGAAVGAINSFGKPKKKKETREQRLQRLIRASVDSALWRIRTKPACKKFLQEEFKTHDPETVLSTVAENKRIRYASMMEIGGAVAQTNVGAGPGGEIRLGERWVSDNSVGGWAGNLNLNSANARTAVMLHEVKHLVGTPHDSVLRNGKWVRRDDDYFMKGIASKCFGK